MSKIIQDIYIPKADTTNPLKKKTQPQCKEVFTVVGGVSMGLAAFYLTEGEDPYKRLGYVAGSAITGSKLGGIFGGAFDSWIIKQRQ